MKRGLAAATLLLLSSCSSEIRLVPRRPFVEHAAISLEDERLEIEVHEDEVLVDALFHFAVHGDADDLVATFPVAPPRGPATRFEARLEPHGAAAAEVLEVTRAAPGALPVGEAIESWDIPMRVGPLVRHGGLLRVRYVQPGRGAFAYLWRTGAYWRGPIRRLDVVLRDPGRRVAEYAIDGHHVATDRRAGDGTLVTSLFDVEPESGLKLVVR